MEIFLMRHGMAADGSEWTRDALRPLTDAGRAEIEAAGRGLLQAGLRFDWILSSPLVRARQTAHAVAASQGGDAEVEEMSALAPGFVAETLLAALGRAHRTRVLLVGHEPDMSHLAARLLDTTVERVPPFLKGTIVRIDVEGSPGSSQGSGEAPPGRLIFALTARQAASLDPA